LKIKESAIGYSPEQMSKSCRMRHDLEESEILFRRAIPYDSGAVLAKLFAMTMLRG
jgi:hypothetical protein